MVRAGEAKAEELRAVMRRFKDQHGRTLESITDERATAVVLLRHSGCPFCREAIADLSAGAGSILERGRGVLLVYQWPAGEMEHLFDREGVRGLPRIADPERELYRALGVGRGNLWQIFGPTVVWRVISAGIAGHRVGRSVGDVMQMPGLVVVHRGSVLARYRYGSQASRPDYEGFVCGVGR